MERIILSLFSLACIAVPLYVAINILKSAAQALGG